MLAPRPSPRQHDVAGLVDVNIGELLQKHGSKKVCREADADGKAYDTPSDQSHNFEGAKIHNRVGCCQGAMNKQDDPTGAQQQEPAGQR